MTIVGFFGSVRKVTERGSGMELIPPSLTLILRESQYGLGITNSKDILETDVSEVLFSCSPAFVALHALGCDSHLRDSA